MLCRGLGRAGFLGGREEQVPEPLLRLSACPGPRIGDSYVGAGGECMASKKCERRDGAMSRHPPAVASSRHSCPKQRTQTRPTMVPSQCSEAESGTTVFHEATGARENHGREGRGVRVIRVSNQNVSLSSVEMPLLPSHPERIVCLAGLYRILGFTSNHPGTTTLHQSDSLTAQSSSRISRPPVKILRTVSASASASSPQVPNLDDPLTHLVMLTRAGTDPSKWFREGAGGTVECQRART